MRSNRAIWLIVVSAVLFLGAAFVTLRAAERADAMSPTDMAAGAAGAAAANLAVGAANKVRVDQTPATPPTHPAPSAPEESATITDDPTTAPDPSQSADNNVSFPTDI